MSDGLEGLLDKAKTLAELNKQCRHTWRICKDCLGHCEFKDTEQFKGKYLLEKDVVEFFKDRTFFAKERSLRKLLKQLEKNENQYITARDHESTDSYTKQYLDGRRRESEIIRIELEKLLEAQK